MSGARSARPVTQKEETDGHDGDDDQHQAEKHSHEHTPAEASSNGVPGYLIGNLYFLKMLLGRRTWTPMLGLSTSCVMATWPAMLTS